MNRLRLAGLLALPLLLATTPTASANPPYPAYPPPGCNGPGYGTPGVGLPCSFAGCGGFCMNLFGRIHFHGPLVNYGPYSGYYPFEPYGPWTSDLRYNPPPVACNKCGTHDRAWRLYSMLTLHNVRDRGNPLKHKCGKGGWSDCSTGGCGSGCATAPGAGVVSVPPVPPTAVAAGAG